mmetsp:Transcript_266/g.578  ORF Transcript_266/g.578 Transcript_266/m.578 type:complete len:290 (-) Transcript_266:2594-3463(-)
MAMPPRGLVHDVQRMLERIGAREWLAHSGAKRALPRRVFEQLADEPLGGGCEGAIVPLRGEVGEMLLQEEALALAGDVKEADAPDGGLCAVDMHAHKGLLTLLELRGGAPLHGQLVFRASRKHRCPVAKLAKREEVDVLLNERALALVEPPTVERTRRLLEIGHLRSALVVRAGCGMIGVFDEAQPQQPRVVLEEGAQLVGKAGVRVGQLEHRAAPSLAALKIALQQLLPKRARKRRGDLAGEELRHIHASVLGDHPLTARPPIVAYGWSAQSCKGLEVVKALSEIQRQ